MRAIIVTDRSYAPGCYILCKLDEQGNAHPRDESSTVLIQTDWDHPSLASRFGWSNPCTCGASDGTVDCDDCGVTAADMISSAGDFLDECAERGTESTDCEDYFPE